MTLTNFRSNNGPAATQNLAAHTFNQLQNDLVSRARMWAVDEVGAAMAHQINEPLTALLLYLHEIKERGEQSTGAEAIPTSVRSMVDLALRETHRVSRGCIDRSLLDLPFEIGGQCGPPLLGASRAYSLG